jgi:stage 0 sporulation regulatory protein
MILAQKRLMVNAMVIISIEEKRQQMIELALTYGFTAKETIECSQELDELINRYLRETAPIEHSSSPVPQ